MRQLFLTSAIVVAMVTSLDCGKTGGSSGPLAGVNGCTDFTDRTAAGASRLINFGDNLGNNYDPKCLAIAVNQSVTYNGSFSVHPLSPGQAPSQAGGDRGSSTGNPIQNTSTGTNTGFVFTTAGTYPYYCTVHQAGGMFGAIQVR